MSLCGACGSENLEGKRFCGDCGAPLDDLCPSCGAQVAPGKRFCGDCGAVLPEVASAPAPEVRARSRAGSEPGGAIAERRICSVLFVDLVGFTPLSESKDPEDVRELLSRYFDEARTVIDRYGGVVEKFIGDAVMAVWGAPVATEGDAERAVRAALDVVSAVAGLGQQVGAPGLAARAGVVTGEVAVTHHPGGEGVAGDTVNTASRVQSIAQPGSVWVDAATHRLAGASVAFTDAGEHLLKGKAEPVPLWVATRVLSGVGGAQRADGLEAPLFGRDAELRTIKELFHASADRGLPRLVVVSGPAGVGKSRLGWEFEKYIDGLAGTVYWHRGRCLSYGEGVAFSALTEIIRQRFGIAEEDPLSMARQKLSDGLLDLIPDDDDRAYVGPRLGRLLGVALHDDAEGGLSREELFAGWRHFFERLAEVLPVVLLVEDAHFGDAALFDFLDHIVDWARSSPIFVLVFARPELDQVRPGFGTGRNRSTLTLDPLDDASMDTLIDALVPGMPEASRSAIRGQAEGIPLFAVETVRSLVDSNVVIPKDGAYQLVGELGALSVPAGLHALLAARLDSLDTNLRTLVAEAAVLGSSFPAEALVAVSSQPEEIVRIGLVELLRRDLFSVSADRLSPQRGDYRFAQELLRQVAYESSARRDRKARHLAVATHLRTTFAADGDEVAEVISRHYLDALSVVPDADDVDDIRAEAIAMLIRAGDRALRAGAPRQAAASYASAAEQSELSAPAGDAQRAVTRAAALLWERAARAGNTANLDDGLIYAARARDLHQQHGDPRAAARAQTIAGELLMRRLEHEEAREVLTRALEVLRDHPDSDTVEALSLLAGVETMSGGPDTDRLTSEAMTLGQSLDIDSGLLADLFTVRGIALCFAGRYAESVAHLEYAAQTAERAGDSSREARAYLNLAEVFTQRDPAAAAAAAHKSAGLARHCGNVTFLSYALGNEVEGFLLLGEWDAALRLVEESAEFGEFMDVFGSILLGLRGDVENASRAAELPALRDSDDAQNRISIALADSVIATARRDYAEGLAQARSALQHSPELGIGHFFAQWAWIEAAHCAQQLDQPSTIAELVALLDQTPVGHLPPLLRAGRTLAAGRLAPTEGHPEIFEAFGAAVSALRKVGSPYHLAHGLLDQAEYLTDVADTELALDLVSEARAIGDKLGAGPLLERCDQVVARIPESADASAT